MPRRILAGLLFGLLVVVSAAGLLARSITTLQAERLPAKHARVEIEALVSFLATAEDAETGQRGYLLTGDSTYLGPYDDARRTIDGQLATLEGLTADDPTERAAVAALRVHVTAKMAELAQTIHLRATTSESPRVIMLEGNGQREMVAIRRIVGALRQEQRLQLDEHLQAYTSGVGALLVNLAIAIALQFALLGLTLLFIRRDQAFRAKAAVRLQASEERFRRLSDAATDGVVVSRDGIILEVNAAWCRMCGLDESTLIGTPVMNVIAPADRDAVGKMVRDNRTVTYTLACLRADGTTFDGQVTARPIVYHGEPARISVVRDVTEWTRVNRLKSEFVSTVSHELRTPLTSIHGALKLVASGTVGTLPAKVEQLLTIAHVNCERLVRLVNDMLDLDKIEAGKLEMRSSALAPADIVRSALDGIRAMAEQYRIRLDEEVDAREPFKGDRDRIIQVLTNLLSNAIKFARPNTVVSIAATHAPLAGQDRIRFAVTNEGPGIQPSDIALLFTRFQQLDASDARHRGGTGLGLAICKAIVEQHGGTIGVDSEPGVTTTFWFELPATRPSLSLAGMAP